MRTALILAAGLFAAPAAAGVPEALDQHILPGFDRFVQETGALARTAEEDCTAGTVAPAYHAAFDTWMPLAEVKIGPSDTGALSVLFWPDDRGFTPKALNGLIADADPVVTQPEDYAEVSIAARGLMALDMLLFDPAYDSADPYTCQLVTAVAVDLARQAETLQAAWADEFAAALRSAGAAENATFLSPQEAMRALYTQVLSGLEFTADQRLGRPLGTFERPRPRRAEAWRSERSLRNVLLAADAAQSLAHALAETDLPLTDAAMVSVREAAAKVNDPGFQDIDDPQARLQVEVLAQEVRSLRTAIANEVGAPLGIAPGFNSSDGD
ncbi:signal peptidase [Thalassococcus profundi]|uniref:Signal peptidase n=1 Tax=Thalassococcus profundi TaxID=2282382 RepID=A0A369TU75_9RHOB|nr:imelysin family protein [Thalassococcus profundi]RDD66506.1 signal peptidase [Thalassococcus profundi]